jgi:hypothetical protein
MSLIEVNGFGVTRGYISLPQVGCWQGQLECNSQNPIQNPITITLGADGARGQLKLVGTARGGQYVDGAFVLVFGGNDNLGKPVKAKHYNSASLRVVLEDILRVTGDRLSATADAATLSRPLPSWTLMGKQACGRSIDLVVKAADPSASWRFLPDGTVWVGPETWPDSGLNDDVVVLDERPDHSNMLMGVEAPTLLPGTTIKDRHVSRVVYDLDGVGARMIVWFER